MKLAFRLPSVRCTLRGQCRVAYAVSIPRYPMHQLRFDNAFVRDLPGDVESGPRLRQVHGGLYSRVDPTPVAAPRVIASSAEVAALLGLEAGDVASPEF